MNSESIPIFFSILHVICYSVFGMQEEKRKEKKGKLERKREKEREREQGKKVIWYDWEKNNGNRYYFLDIIFLM